MNLEEFGPDAKDEMSPADYIKFLMDKFYEYRTLAMDPTINDQATKLYLEKASDYYARAQEVMDEIEPDNVDHLSDEDKALPNVPLSTRDKAMVDDYEEEEANREINKVDADMYRESISGIGGTGGSQPTVLFSDIRSKLIEIETLINQLEQTDEYKMGNEVGNKIGPKAFAFIGTLNSVINVFRERGYIKENINSNRWDKLAGLDK